MMLWPWIKFLAAAFAGGVVIGVVFTLGAWWRDRAGRRDMSR